MNNMGSTESNIIKARSGRYKDTEENRRLHRVGQQYGEKKAPTTEVGSKDLSKYDTKTLQNTSKAMADKIREMRNTLSNMQGDERAMEAVQVKIDSAEKGLAAVNSELAKRGIIEATGNTAKEVDLAGLDNETLEEYIVNTKQTIEIYKRGLENATTDKERGSFIDKIARQEKRLKAFEEEVTRRKLKEERFDAEEREYEERKKKLEREEFIREEEDEKLKKKAEKQGRVYLSEAPNSSKVNLTKYLSAKAKANIDRILGQVIPTKSRTELIAMYDDAVKTFNEGFDGMKKSARANMLYQILTIKAALDSKQGDKADIPLVSNMSKEEFAEYIASPRGAARKAEMEAKIEQIREEHRRKLDALDEEATKAYKSSGVDKIHIGDGAMNMYWKDDGELSVQGPSKWTPEQDYTVRVPGAGNVYFNSEYAQVFTLAGKLLTDVKMKKQALDFLKKYQDILANTSKIQRETLAQYPDFSSDGTGVRIE